MLLRLGSGAVFGNRELVFFVREHGVGDEVEEGWAHDGNVHRVAGRLSGARPAGARPQRVSYSGRSTSTEPSRTRAE